MKSTVKGRRWVDVSYILLRAGNVLSSPAGGEVVRDGNVQGVMLMSKVVPMDSILYSSARKSCWRGW
jgi:hypothetical protein